jgi:hypothetical protein
MKSEPQAYSLNGPAQWEQFRTKFGLTSTGPSLEICKFLEKQGVNACLVEPIYFDKDFTDAYSRFYAKLYKPYHKFCTRLHFFKRGLAEFKNQMGDPVALSEYVKSKQADYAGFVVLRPLEHAPVSVSVIGKHVLDGDDQPEVLACSKFVVHVLGAELSVVGFPFTEQEARIGACAQADIWMAARHFHNRRKGRWVSLGDITECALGPSGTAPSDSVPAGAKFLDLEQISRALTSIGRHPIFFDKRSLAERKRNPVEIVRRYIDSGIPVLLMVGDSAATMQHILTVCGFCTAMDGSVSAFLVHDDRRGIYLRMAVGGETTNPSTGWSQYNIEDHLNGFFVPLPDKVYITAEQSEEASEKKFSQIVPTIYRAHTDSSTQYDSSKFQFISERKYTKRTYLTFGYRFRERIIQNEVDNLLKSYVNRVVLPKFVWVTEFRRIDMAAGSLNSVDAISVLDATGSELWNSVILIYTCNVLMTRTYDIAERRAIASERFELHSTTTPLNAKVRGE